MSEPRTWLREYLEENSEQAFRQIVARYIDLVHSTALRCVGGDSHRAQDVTQIVFADLARMARKLSRDVALGGWLYRHTCFVAANVLRQERRRAAREQRAMEMHTLENSAAAWKEVAPVLDEALQQLGKADQEAVVLRFFERLDFRGVGDALGSNEDAAQKRVARALEKLRQFLARRGVVFSAPALGAVLANHAVTTAPAGLAAAIGSSALTATTIATGFFTLCKIMSIAKFKTAVIGAIIAAGVATPLILQQQSIQRLNVERTAFQRDLLQLQQNSADLSNRLARASASSQLSDNQSRELARLRGEVGLLRLESQELARWRAQKQLSEEPKHDANSAPPFLPSAAWANVGTASAEAALQTFFWAAKNGDTNLITNLIRWRKADSVPEFDGLGKIMQSLIPATKRFVSKLDSIRIAGAKQEDPNTTRVRVEFISEGGDPQPREFQFVRVENEWMPLFHVFSPKEGSIQTAFDVPLSADLGAVAR